ncbi:MAG: sensor domain-containing diguanylate cyclase [Planctomycetes bacterium]|nr:sensor domain-containing diguanylate cyclase [Planctomycetota bacterium]
MRWSRALVLAVPALALGAVAWLRRDALLGACAAYAAVLAVVLRRPREVREVAALAAERERAFSRERAELQARIDRLSAEREIGLILNEDVDFRTILDKVLTITADTLGADGIEIHLRDEKGDLVPRAARADGRTTFDVAARKGDPLLAAVLEHGKAIQTAEEGRLTVMAPLSSDRELVGVVRVVAPPDRGEQISRHLAEFSKFLALALKTPDLYTRATVDGLTGLSTKRRFLQQLDAEVAAARRTQETPSLVMIDIDHFKKVNDTYGHQAGDRILRGVAEVILNGTRRSDGAAFRYGGVEMAILLNRTRPERAAEASERIRRAIQEKKFLIDRRRSIHVTASFGVAGFDLSMEDGAELIRHADEALYRAKEGGRNRVVLAERPVRV